MVEDPEHGSVEPIDEGLAAALAITAAWPDNTFIVRAGLGDAYKLELALIDSIHPAYEPPLRGWSVQAKPGASVTYLCQPFLNTMVRVTTLLELRIAGGQLAKTPGAHEHCTLFGIDASTFDGILSKPQRNPYSPTR